MLTDGAILILPNMLVCGDNGSNFSACSQNSTLVQ